MLFAKIVNLPKYQAILPWTEKLMDYLRTHDPKTLRPGKYEIAGEALYISVQEYLTEPAFARPWECHRRYLDLQYMVEGEEILYMTPAAALQNCGEYNAQSDCVLSHSETAASSLLLKTGDCVLLTPEEAHKPKCIAAHPCNVKKAVIKIRI